MSWEDRAECKMHPARWWFSDEKASRTKAVAVCAECPVAEPCLAGALERKERFGVWSGVDFGADERRKKQRQSKGVAA